MTNTTTYTIIPTQDRDYYHSLPTAQLVEAVRYAVQSQTNWQELAIALAERLVTKQRALEEKHYDYLADRYDADY